MAKNKLITNEKPLKIEGEFKDTLREIIKKRKAEAPKKEKVKKV